jgi:hypothetical protein
MTGFHVKALTKATDLLFFDMDITNKNVNFAILNDFKAQKLS